MQFARPPDGFRVFQKPPVDETLTALADQCAWLIQAYEDAIARLKISGHNEGKLSSTVPGLRSVVEVNPLTGRKRLGISYIVLGDRLTVYAIRVLAMDGGFSAQNGTE
jgi:hypothetical protein